MMEELERLEREQADVSGWSAVTVREGTGPAQAGGRERERSVKEAEERERARVETRGARPLRRQYRSG